MNQPIRQTPGEQGFSQLILMVTIGAVIVATGGGVYYQQSAKQNKSASETQVAQKVSSDEKSSAPVEQPKPQTTEVPKPVNKSVVKKESPKQVKVASPQTISAQKLATHEMPKLFDLEFKSGVNKSDEAEMRRGFKSMDFYLNEWFGHSITKKSAFRIEATNQDSKLVEENGTFVFLFRTLSTDWQIPKQNGEQGDRVAAHEYVHLYQINNGCAHVGRVGEKPKWFVEGMADWLSYKAVKGSWSFPFWFKFAVPQMGGLKQIQTYDEARGVENIYPYFASAVDFLMKNKDIKTLEDFCINLGKKQEISVAFQNAFDIPLEQFYSDFKAYFTKTFSIPIEEGVPLKGEVPSSGGGDESQIPQGYSSWADFCKVQPKDSRCTVYKP